jgi:hypothetical protein
MIDADQAKSIVLRRSEASSQSGDRFAIQSCVLSDRGDYWIVRANSEDFVVRGVQERQYVGANAHLVNAKSGAVETVGSGQSVEQYLKDKYDVAVAGDNHYVLVCGFDNSDKASVIHLRQKLDCTLQIAVQLTSEPSRVWLYGKRSALLHAQELLQREGIATNIQLQAKTGSAVWIDHSVWHWEAVKAALMSCGLA